MVSTVAYVNNILARLLHFIARISAVMAVQGGSLSKNGYC